jgi:phage shock protein A
MGILQRFSDIMGANVNSVLSKSESANADKLLAKYIEDAKKNLGQVKAETAATIAEETGIARKLTETQELSKKYESYALAAVQAQNDDDARKFLGKQNKRPAVPVRPGKGKLGKNASNDK